MPWELQSIVLSFFKTTLISQLPPLHLVSFVGPVSTKCVAVIEVVDFDTDRVVEYGQTGRVKLTTLTQEFFVPGFLERDEGEREQPCELYPWDGVSGVRPFHRLAAATTVGVY